MEIIVELIFQVIGWIFQFLGELVLQVIFEGIAELFGHSVKTPFRRQRPMPPWLAATGYLFFGAVAGGITICLVPELFIKDQWLRLANLVLTPLVAGIIMEAIGSWRKRREREVLRLESFAYGFCFAFAMGLVRYTFGK